MSYPKVYRIPVPSFARTRGKHYLSKDEVDQLLDGTVVMEEKIDGKIDGVVLAGKTVFFEFMKYKHTIFYTQLPSFQMGFDVWDGSRFLNLSEKTKFLEAHGFAIIRKIFYGTTNYEELLKFLPKLLALKSAYGDEVIEGIVIKNYAKQQFAKIVNSKFEEVVDEAGHWSKQQIVLNRIKRKS